MLGARDKQVCARLAGGPPTGRRSRPALGKWVVPMINRHDHPVGWALFHDELSDAHEHLESLLGALERDPDYGEEALRVDLGHILAHLHRAWYRRNCPEDITNEQWEQSRETPRDLDPLA